MNADRAVIAPRDLSKWRREWSLHELRGHRFVVHADSSARTERPRYPMIGFFPLGGVRLLDATEEPTNRYAAARLPKPLASMAC
jgi:hypothetical protein